MSIEDAPARKRPRFSSLEPTGEPAHDIVVLVRDEELWFEDGNVILIARNVQFRVYQGMLAVMSPGFKDLFTRPPPPGDVKTSEQTEPICLVVHLEDSPEDLRHVLRAYMPLNDSSPYKPQVCSFHAISASIRLGHKYQIAKLVDHHLASLESLFSAEITIPHSRDVPYPREFEPEHAIGVVNLARLTGKTSLLPTALLFCCALGGDIVHGMEREDGSREYLSPEDLSRCFNGILRLGSATFAAAVSVFPKESSCTACFAPTISTISPLIDGETATGRVFFPLQSFMSLMGDRKLCKPCRTTLRNEDLKARQALWKRLPEIFDVTVE